MNQGGLLCVGIHGALFVIQGALVDTMRAGRKLFDHHQPLPLCAISVARPVTSHRKQADNKQQPGKSLRYFMAFPSTLPEV